MANMSFRAIRKTKILTKISEFTVLDILYIWANSYEFGTYHICLKSFLQTCVIEIWDKGLDSG